MYTKPHIREAIAQIENRLAHPLDIETVSRMGLVSSMQLYRDFYNLTGHSVKEYIRKRRLSNALALLKHSNKSIADIAYACGYSSQQAFSKAVKEATGQTPLEYKHSASYYYFPRFDGPAEHHIHVAAKQIPETISVEFHHEQLQGIEQHAIRYLQSVLPEFQGRIFGRNEARPGIDFIYVLYLSGAEPYYEILLQNGGFVKVEKVPGFSATFAMASVQNNEVQIGSAWDYLYGNWLKTSMFEQEDRPYFEEYILRNGRVKKLMLYLPVKKRNDYDKIRILECEEMTFLVSRSRGPDAEEQASGSVIDFLIGRYPDLAKEATQFYVSNHEDEYVCGIRIDKLLELPEQAEVEILTSERGRFAILEGNGCVESAVYEKLLFSWVRDNGFEMGGSVFAIYEYGGIQNRESTRVHIFCSLK
ncbi:AraC-like DNA-binding protein [Fontibacillus phaseoli]|uniref:AraC-like DNA-binding protein n=1 Tax=Fontibacillus phaseoli TaxID=1416533 RepID=A0A369BM72_9BACL|nr:helix-turn-helix domain-containing protein [Fontibacillus phaseoli]RCX22702.1 AraC-like DNA-binding protein [Fontibacillus phaseoli]